MNTALLNDRAQILLSGHDAEHFLQNIVTVDLDQLAPGEIRPGALLTPHGKILFDFLVSRAGENRLRLDCRADVADDFIRRLAMYRLRAKVDISKQDQSFAAVAWGSESDASRDESSGLVDRRFHAPARAYRFYDDFPAATATPADWHAFRIANAVAESGSDYGLGDAFPHDVLLDQSGGVGFRKGCYVGQEVVSRMQHRGTARRRILHVRGEAGLPPAGAELTAGGRAIGTLGSVSGKDGIAILRIDRVKDALDAGVPILAGDVGVQVAIPAWANFTFPLDAAASGDA